MSGHWEIKSTWLKTEIPLLSEKIEEGWEPFGVLREFTLLLKRWVSDAD